MAPVRVGGTSRFPIYADEETGVAKQWNGTGWVEVGRVDPLASVTERGERAAEEISLGSIASVAMQGVRDTIGRLGVAGLATGAPGITDEMVAADIARRQESRPQQPGAVADLIGGLAPEFADVTDAYERGAWGEMALESADALGQTVWDAARNPGAAAYLTAESLANMVPSVVLGYLGGQGGAGVGALTGAALGAPAAGAGAAPGAVAGSIIGGTVGAAGGMMAGQVPVEMGAEIEQALFERMEADGADPRDRDTVLQYLRSPGLLEEARAIGVRKGIGTGGSDAIMNAAIGLLSRGIVNNVSRAVVGGTAQLASEPTSEAVGQLYAHGEMDPEELAAEALGGFGPAAAETALTSFGYANPAAPRQQPPPPAQDQPANENPSPPTYEPAGPGLPAPEGQLALPSPEMVANQPPPDLGRGAVYPIGGGRFVGTNAAGQQQAFASEAEASQFANTDTRPPPGDTMDRLAAAQAARRASEGRPTGPFAPASAVPTPGASPDIAGFLPPPEAYQPTPPVSTDPYSPIAQPSGPAIARPGDLYPDVSEDMARMGLTGERFPLGERTVETPPVYDPGADMARFGIAPQTMQPPGPATIDAAAPPQADGVEPPSYEPPAVEDTGPAAPSAEQIRGLFPRGYTAEARGDQIVVADEQGRPVRSGAPGRLEAWKAKADRHVQDRMEAGDPPAVNDGPSVAETDGDAAAQGAVADAQTMEETGAPPVVDARERQRQENIARVQEALPGYPVGQDVNEFGGVTEEAAAWLFNATDEQLDAAERLTPIAPFVQSVKEGRAGQAAASNPAAPQNPPPSGRPAIISTVPDALTRLNARLPEGFTAARSTEDNAEVLVSDAAGNVVARDRVPTGTVTLDQIVEDIGRRPAPTPTDTASLESMFTDLVAEEFGDTTPAARPAPESRPAPAAPPASSPDPAASEPAPASAPRGPTVDFVSVGPDGQSSTFTPSDPTLAAAGQSTASGRPVRPRTAGEAAGSAARNLGGAASDGLRGLMQLFGNADPNRLGSGPTFDEETYRQAVPYFKSAAQQVGAAAQDVADIMRAIIRALRDMGMDRAGVDRMAPYAARFVQDVQAGRETLDESGSQLDRDGGNIEDSDQETGDGGQIRDLGEEGESPASGGGRRLSGAEDRDGTGSDNALEGEPTADDEAVRGGRGGRGGRSRSGGSRGGRGQSTDRTGNAVPRRDGARDGGLDDDGAGGRAAGGGRANFHLTDPKAIVGGTPKKRFAKNRAAIETLRDLQETGREPTAEELNTLAGYTGWGSFGQQLFQGNWSTPKPQDGWQKEDAWLREHLGKSEWESAQDSIINAHYTDPPTVTAMWDMVREMGFKGGRVLEPSVGVGNFLGLMPRDMEAKSQITGIELDGLTASIAKILYPRANIQQKGYQDSLTPDDFYDLAIGNWPFNADGPADRRYLKINPSLHDYFFLKALDQVRPGGLVVGITSAGTMDKKNVNTRAALAEKADLVASFRLPSGAFEEYAGTSVVTDIIILQKRDKPNPAARREPWVPVEQVDTPAGEPVTVNAHYAQDPSNVLGRLNYGSGSTYGRPAMIVDRPANLMKMLTGLKDQVPKGIYQPRRRGGEERFVTNNTTERQGAIIKGKDGDIWVVRGEQLESLNSLRKWKTQNQKQTQSRKAQFEALIDIRTALGSLLDAERNGDAKADDIRADLRRQYRAFKKDHGTIAKSYAIKHMTKVRDPFAPMLLALETRNGKEATILSKATLRPTKTIENPTVAQAYVIARNESLIFDIDRVVELSAGDRDTVISELVNKGLIYRQPGGDYDAADIYLSGNVRQKLRAAEAALAEGEPMQASVDALKAVVPANIPYFQIEAKPGATWIPFDVYRDWIAALLGRPAGSLSEDDLSVSYKSGKWDVSMDAADLNGQAATTKWYHASYPFSRMAQAAMNNTRPVITYRDSDGNKVRDREAEEQVAIKVTEMRESMQEWLWTDPARRDAMAAAYNETMNAIVSPTYDGTFLDMAGMMLARGDQPFNLRSHQLNAIWRGLLNGSGIYGHEVGTGKTYTMAGLAVESRRYGRAKKPLILAHNANSAAVAAEINEMYPGAKVLYLGDLKGEDLQVAIQQIAMDDWDAVVMPHSKIDNMVLSEETLTDLAAQEIGDLEEAAMEAAQSEESSITPNDFNALEDEDGNAFRNLRSPTAKALVRQRNRIKERIRKNALRASKKDAVTFESLGIDMLIVDEAHEFKKPPFATRMKIKGLNNATSDRSVQLDFLAKHIGKINGGTGVHLFTGTPITNTLAEIFHMMRYAMRPTMDDANVDQWDGWFNTFAAEVDDIEITASGVMEPVVRLASFINVAELRRMASQYLDVVFADGMPEFSPRATKSGKTLQDDLTESERAELESGRSDNPVGRPYKRIINEVAPMSPVQLTARAEIISMLNAFKNMSPLERKRNKHIPLVAEGQAAAIALDPRLKDMNRPDEPDSKANRVVARVLDIAQDPNATQMIFMEQGFSDTKEVKTTNSETGEVTKRREPAFNLAKDIVKKLIAGGMKESEIAIVDGDTKPEQKRLIADAMNRAEIRVMIGQTKTMGTGVNAQTNMRAMHHLDAPWMPGELEQRNGRGWRQGNTWNTVLEYRYMTDRLDGRRWQVLAVKARFIRDFLTANENTRVIDGDAADDTSGAIDDLTDSLSVAAGDSRIMLRAKLLKDVEKLERRWALHESGAREARREIGQARTKAATLRDAAARSREDAAHYADNRITKATLDITVRGKNYNDVEAANEALAAAIQRGKDQLTPGQTMDVGEVAGFTLTARKENWQDYRADGSSTFEVALSATRKSTVKMSSPTVAAIQSNLARLETIAESEDASAQGYAESAERLTQVAEMPFGQMDALENKRKALAALEDDLSNNPEPPPSWLRQGAPVQTMINVGEETREVTGHRWNEDGWFIITEAGMVPYLDAKDEYGVAIYEKREFEPPPDILPKGELSKREVADGFKLKQDGSAWRVVRTADGETTGQGETKEAAIQQFRLVRQGLSTNTDAEVDAAAENVSYSLAPLGRQSKGRASAAAEVIGLVSQMTGGQAEVTTAEVIYGAGQGLQRSGALTGERQRVAGFYDPTRALVGVALDGYEADVTAVHEAVHFLQDKGLIPEADRKLLRADRARLERAAIGEGFEPEAAKRMTQTELEAVAAQGYYRRRKVGEDIGGYSVPMRRVFNRLMQFFERLGNALRGRGYRSLDDVFGDMIEGRMANPPKLTGREFGTAFSQIRKRAEEHLLSLRGQTVVNRATGMQIEFDKTGMKRAQRAGADLLRTLPAIKEMLERGVPLPGETVDASKVERGVKAVYKFRAEAIVGGDRKRVILTVREMGNGRFFYAINDDMGESSRRREALTGASAAEPSTHWKDSPAGTANIAAELEISNPDADFGRVPRTTAFQRWFAGSKVVDRAGDPLVVYHGTQSDFAAFDMGLAGSATGDFADSYLGAFFTNQPKAANVFARGASGKKADGANVVPAYLSIANPLVIDLGADGAPKKITDFELFRRMSKALGVDIRALDKRAGPNMRDALISSGYDGVIVRSGKFGKVSPAAARDAGGQPGVVDMFIATRPEQIKSTFNIGTFDGSDPRISYSSMPRAAELDVSNPEVQYRIFQRAAAPAYAQGRVRQDQTPDAIKDVMGRVMAQPDNRSIRERARDAKAAYSGKLKSKLRTGLVDDFDPLREPYPRAWRRYKQTRNLSSVINHVIEFGHMRWDPESRWFASGAATNDGKPVEGVKGLRQVLQPAIDSGLLDTWKAHRIAKRAKRLAAEGLERLVSQEDIAKVEAAVAGLTDQQREILTQTDRDFNRLNRGMIKAAVDSGLIDGDIAEQLLQHGDWIPFYRVLDGDATAGGLLADRKNPQANLKRLKGSTREMLDPLEGVTRNYIRLTDAMFKNAAKRQAHKMMIQQGDAEFMSPGRVPVDKAMVDGRLAQLAAEYGFKPDNLPPATVSAWQKMIRDQIIEETMTRDGDVSVHYERGAKRFVRVHDPEMLATIEAVGPRETDRLLRLMGIPKRILTKAVTATPVFMASNAVRDTLGAWVTGETKGFRPFAGAMVGAVKAMRNDPDLLQMMATGSGSGGYFNTTSKHIEDRMKRMDPAKRSAFQKTVVDTPAKMWDAWERIGQASEAANRLEIYQKQRQSGVGVADAAFMGMDLIDFASTGKWWVARSLIEVVPFLNPRIQGLDKLARTMTGRRALINGSIIAAASMALAAANGDDERYERLENWEKNLYWHIWLDDDPDSSPIRIPKPFEVGILFGSVWERAVDQATGRDRPADFRTFIQDSLTDTLAFNPWPQAILPYVEMTQNRSHFYDRPIETFGMSFRDPETRYNERTSETMRVISAALAESPAKGAELSPVQLEHLWKGYFGTLGTYALGAADQVTRWAGDFPDRPSDGMRGIPVLGPVIRRFSPEGVSRNSRYLTQFYDFASEIDQLKSTLNWAQNNNDERLIAEIMGDERDRTLLRARSTFRDLRSRFSDANERIRQIRNSDMTRDEKRRRIDAIALNMHQQAQSLVGRLNEQL